MGSKKRWDGYLFFYASKRRAADKLAQEVNAYRREHDHPIRDSRKLKIDYDAMLRALEEYRND